MNIVSAIKNGNENIYEQVFNEYHSKLYAFILSKTNATFIAEEVTQIAFIKLWQYRTSLNEDLPISTQLFRIARTSLIDVLRKEACRLKALGPVAVEVVTTNTIEEDIYHKELLEKLNKAINNLPVARRKVFQLSRFEGLSYKEIANELSLSTKTVEHHIALALKQLRHFMTMLSICIISLLF